MAESRPKTKASSTTAAEATEGPQLRELLKPRNTVEIEVKTHFELDDARIFDLNGKGITLTVVTEN